ncbi:hypothetical protein ACFLT9_08880 [Acidobacteriota bacterium]
MSLDKNQEALYLKTMEEAKKQIELIDEEMQKVVDKTRATLEQLQKSKNSLQQVYEGAAKLLDIQAETDTSKNKTP